MDWDSWARKAEEEIEKVVTAPNDGGLPPFPLGGPVFQEFKAPPCLQGRYVITGSWIVNGTPAGVCFREDISLTTNDDSCIVPHWVEGVCGAYSGESICHLSPSIYPCS